MRGRPGRVLAAAVLVAAASAPAHALRVTTWNILDYPNLSFSTRQPHFRTVMQALDTDVLVVQEIKSAAGADSFLAVLRSVQPARGWKGGASLFLSSCESALFYDSLKVTHQNNIALATAGPRDVQVTTIRPNGYTNFRGHFRLYSAHLKAGNPSSSPADSTTRRQECTDLRNHMNAAPANTNIILAGDMNFYGAWEGGYIRLTESQPDNDGRLQDPITMTSTWQSASNAIHHTQCPCISPNCAAGFSGGGLDDRFDMLLGSTHLFDGEGLDRVPGLLPNGYGAFGNDGFHHDTSVDGSNFNLAVGLPVAQALRQASDHLPVIMTLQLPAKVAAPHVLAFGDAIVGGTATASLTVGNSAVVPADELDYTLVAPVGFTVAGGPHQAQAGVAANAHLVSMLTLAPGLMSGTLVVTSDDVDSSAKSVNLSGRVLARAEASLDSLAALTSTLLDLGTHPSGGFTPGEVRVHNRAYDPLQARLQTQSATLTGGAGRFSLVGGFAPALLADIGQTLAVQFDDVGATPDSAYEATLTIASADETLPGAAAHPDLVVTLRAERSSGGLGAGDRVTAFALHAPTPNPLHRATTLAFDLPRSAALELTVHDLSGRRVATLAEGPWPAGRHQAQWRAADDAGRAVAAGLYFVRMRAGEFSRVARVAVLP